jgi:hypothetical protein
MTNNSKKTEIKSLSIKKTKTESNKTEINFMRGSSLYIIAFLEPEKETFKNNYIQKK